MASALRELTVLQTGKAPFDVVSRGRSDIPSDLSEKIHISPFPPPKRKREPYFQISPSVPLTGPEIDHISSAGKAYLHRRDAGVPVKHALGNPHEVLLGSNPAHPDSFMLFLSFLFVITEQQHFDMYPSPVRSFPLHRILVVSYQGRGLSRRLGVTSSPWLRSRWNVNPHHLFLAMSQSSKMSTKIITQVLGALLDIATGNIALPNSIGDKISFCAIKLSAQSDMDRTSDDRRLCSTSCLFIRRGDQLRNAATTSAEQSITQTLLFHFHSVAHCASPSHSCSMQHYFV